MRVIGQLRTSCLSTASVQQAGHCSACTAILLSLCPMAIQLSGLTTFCLPTGSVQPPSQQATRHARRIYVGGLPPTANEQNIATFFSNALAAVGGTTAGPGDSLHLLAVRILKGFVHEQTSPLSSAMHLQLSEGPQPDQVTLFTCWLLELSKALYYRDCLCFSPPEPLSHAFLRQLLLSTCSSILVCDALCCCG